MGHWRKPAEKRPDREPEKVGPKLEKRPSSRESSLWASRLTIDAIAALATISMSKTSLTDDDMERWCWWLRHYLARQPHCTLGLVDFAENRLTAKGVRHLLATFLELQLPVQVLKLHHNRIAEGSCFAAYLQRGWLHELHLSHNELDAQASAAIIEAAVHASDESAKIYPRRVGKGNSAPLWVRLEQNYIDPTVFSSILDAKFGPDLGRSICCDARSKWCTPHNCIQQAAFVVHLKNLFQQRRRGSGPPQASQSTSMTGTTTRRADGSECAHVLCFDWDRGSWVPESIEIPVIDTSGTAAMTEGLKVLIGAGMNRPERETPNDKPLILSQEEGQSMGADLLHSIRKKGPVVPPMGPAPRAAPVAPPVAPPAPSVPLGSAQARQAAAAQAAAAQVHLARVAAAHLARQHFEEDAKAWLRIEAPVFHPGARCFFATSEAPESQLLSAETSAGAASDDTESLEVTAGSAGADAIDVEPVTGRSNTDSPQSKRRTSFDDQSSPAQWLSRAAPPLEDLPVTSLWKNAKSEAKSAQGSVAERFSTTPAPEGLSKLNPPAPRGQKTQSSKGSGAAQWLSVDKVPEKWSDVFEALTPPALKNVPKMEGFSDSSAKSVQKPLSAMDGFSETATSQPPARPAPPMEPVPPEIEKPLVVHEERPEVVGEAEEAEEATDPPEVAPLDHPQREPMEETPPPCGKETQEFPSARVHQVFNILEDEPHGRDASPRVLEVWKVEASATPTAAGPTATAASPAASPAGPGTETSKQGQCSVM